MLPYLGYLPRKEVIQPQVLLQLPCYDFTPIIAHTLGIRLHCWLAKITSGTKNSRGVTGGVYKVRERIHRAVADARLLAISTSWSRVADSNPNLDQFFEISMPSRVSNPLYWPL